MGDAAIRIEGLGKRYRVGKLLRYKTLRDAIAEAAGTPLRAVASLLKGGRAACPIDPGEEFLWALQDISLEIKRGEVLGIIGYNGAGKTTLLKILSRITEPTRGSIEIYGRVGSLLELGTGFHPELTGRENIYLNGAILGMLKREINRKFDEIVAFAEVEKFIDTPIKFYSTGMYVRLAFAVAAHLEPEILLVDEVLAVGDAAFQRKCLGRMGAVANEGRTVLFVSHNMTAIRSLCTRTLLVDAGTVRYDGEAGPGIDRYLAGTLQDDWSDIDTEAMARPNTISEDSGLRILKVMLTVPSGSSMPRIGQPLAVTMECRCTKALRDVSWGFYLETPDGLRLLDLKSASVISPTPLLEPGKYRITGSLLKMPLAPGLYRLGVGVRDAMKGLDWLPHVTWLHVDDQRYTSLWFEQTTAIFRSETSWDPPDRIGNGAG